MIVLYLAGRFFLIGSWVQAEEMNCPEHFPVSIDVRPGGYPNSIDLSARGLVAVVVLTTDDFDANQFTPEMVHLFDAAAGMGGGCEMAAQVRRAREDENRDGRPDIVFFFDIQTLTLNLNTTDAMLMAHGWYGSSEFHIMGTDTVRIKE